MYQIIYIHSVHFHFSHFSSLVMLLPPPPYTIAKTTKQPHVATTNDQASVPILDMWHNWQIPSFKKYFLQMVSKSYFFGLHLFSSAFVKTASSSQSLLMAGVG